MVIKIAEGSATKEDYADVIAQRQAWREEIESLKLIRILLISLLIAIATAVFFKLQSDNRLQRAVNAENRNTTLVSKIKGYENGIQKHNDAQARAGEKIEKVRTIVRTVKSDCDCWHTLVDDRVRDEIRKRRNHLQLLRHCRILW